MAELAPRGVKLAAYLMFNRLDTDGVTYMGWRKYPNVSELSVTPKATLEKLTSTDPENYGAQIDSYAVSEPTIGKLTVNRIEHRSALTAVLLGLDDALLRTSASDTATVTLPSPGVYAEIGHAGLSGVTVTQPNYNQNGTGESGVLVYRKSGTPTITYTDPAGNSAALTVSVAGNDITVSLATDGTSTPISTAAEVVAAINANSSAFALVGAVILDGYTGTGVVAAATQATLADGGLLTADTDYSILSTVGMITSIAGGAGLPGVPQALAFTKNAQTGFVIAGNRVTQVKGKLKMGAQNQVSGKSWLLESDSASFSPDGDLSLVGGDAFAVASWAIAMEVPAGGLSPYTLKVW
jgi:hypothetical protein